VSAAVQTLWCELLAATLRDAGVATCVVSPGSRSTPLVLALAADGRFTLPNVIDERAAAFFALGEARATGRPVAMVCTSGSAAAHYLPAIVEASLAGVPLVAITADRPPELQQCGATQTIDQVKIYGGFVRGAFDLGAPVAAPVAFRGVRRKVGEAVALATGPHPGPVHLEVPLRKPLEPALPATDDERALARLVADLRGPRVVSAPRLVASDDVIVAAARAFAGEPRGVIVAGALQTRASHAREALFALAARTGYPVLAEAGSQLRFAARPAGVTVIDHHDLLLASPAFAGAPMPRLILQLGAEPVAAGWAVAQSVLAGAERWVLAEHGWHDPDSSARGVIVGDLCDTAERITARLPARDDGSFAAQWAAADARAGAALETAVARHPRSETALLRAVVETLPENVALQLGNSLPIRTIDQVRDSRPRAVLTQRGAAGIDGLVASAAGATRGGPVLLVLGDVSFAHDLGGLLATREASAPLAILVIDNAGGRIFDGLPIARAGAAATFERHFLTAPALDPTAVAAALGIRSATAPSGTAAAATVVQALATGGVTVIHAPVAPTGAHDVRRDALALLAAAHPVLARAPVPGETHA
jgi:2-succinyl-5-enolpyruvyl-6-hydroxy-3-cyclohexene-1-carboxylate synthase